ncbi:MAG: ROK family protein [Gemmatimonadetes bacterium]|nr:ROK family protein [Gemmatimonadota bacterium]MDA1104177.1 ROK family protein [Gemmatimonadota bacterium]
MSGRWVLGVDIGGTNLVVASVPLAPGHPAAVRSRDTIPARGPDAAVRDIGAMAEEVIDATIAEFGGAREDFVGVGIGCPGPLDLTTGVVISTPNLGWDGYPIRARISEVVGLPATLDNDGNCATYGEWWRGAGQGASSIAGVTVGTGIGGGLVVDGQVLRGVSGSAGEIGHMTIDFSGRRCACGNVGCLEAYTSGPNIAARAREGLAGRIDSILASLVDGQLDRITARTVYDGVVRGDAYAADVMKETAKILGVGVANIVNVFNPEVVVIVGGVTRAGEYLFGPLREEVGRRAFPSAVSACSIVPGALPETAGVIGAAGIFVAEHERIG